MAYVREYHGGIFRRVALSGLLDSAERPHKKNKNTIPTTRIVRYDNTFLICMNEIQILSYEYINVN